MKGRFKSLSRFNANSNFYRCFGYVPIKHSLPSSITNRFLVNYNFSAFSTRPQINHALIAAARP
jgi:hypothetical protein